MGKRNVRIILSFTLGIIFTLALVNLYSHKKHREETKQEMTQRLIDEGIIATPYKYPSREHQAVAEYYQSLTPKEVEAMAARAFKEGGLYK